MKKTTVYITRDSDGSLNAFTLKPVKGSKRWQLGSPFNDFFPLRECDLPDCVNPSWKDEEPTLCVYTFKACKSFKLMMWLCCDKDGGIYIYRTKPVKDKAKGIWITKDLEEFQMWMEIVDFDDYFPHITKPTWNDDEPIAVRMNLDELTSDSIGHNI